MNRFKYPPLVTTELSPTEVLGHRAESFLSWYRQPRSARDKSTKEFKSFVGTCIDDLHRHGFVPAGMKKDGTIRWKVIVMSPLQHEFFHGNNPEHGPSLKELQEKPTEELMEMASKGLKSLLGK